MQSFFRLLPSVDATKQALLREDPSFASLPHALVRETITAYWDGVREKIRLGEYSQAEELALERHLPALRARLTARAKPKCTRVINGTGVVIHTNMGRSVLAKEAQEAVALAAAGYCNVELDLSTGTRGSRYDLFEEELCALTGAEAALAVNNNAAAVLLMLDTFCRGAEVVVSRGELVEIGGSFRIPEVMAKGGAILREVGATNRTHTADYIAAIGPATRALLRVHTSNFRIIGFHSSVPLEDLAELAHAKELLMLVDLGSGSLVHCSESGLPDEPTVQETLAAGADLVTFSGDKVLGGPQAGLVVGRRDLITQMKRNQLTRALRCDKLCLAALEATLRLYRTPETAKERIPTLRRIVVPEDVLRAAATELCAMLQDLPGCTVTVRPGSSRVGGGAYPQYDVPTHLVSITSSVRDMNDIKTALLACDPPVIGRLDDESFCLDPRTLDSADFPLIAKLLRQAVAGRP